MSTNKLNIIHCPECNTEINVEAVLAKQIESSLELKYAKKMKELDEQKEKQDEYITQQIKQKEKELRANLKKEVGEDYETELKMLKENLKETKDKLQQSKQTELKLRKREEELEEKKQSLELDAKKQVEKEREHIEQRIKKQVEDNHFMKLKEKDMQMNRLKEQIEELKRKSEQGSVQSQGEVQELALEEMLRKFFPEDLIEEVKKGQNGADVNQTVKNVFGKKCGLISYESKRTKKFGNDWIEKLKDDMRRDGADIGVIVTEVMPKDMDRFGMRDGVWICTYHEVFGLAIALRDLLIKVHEAKASQENRSDKMALLYEYLTSNEFRLMIEGLVDSYTSMRGAIDKHKRATYSYWKKQEKQLEKMMKNTVGIYGSLRGIAGNALQEVQALEMDESLFLEEKI